MSNKADNISEDKEAPEEPPTAPTAFTCEICGRVLATKKGYASHVSSHKSLRKSIKYHTVKDISLVSLLCIYITLSVYQMKRQERSEDKARKFWDAFSKEKRNPRYPLLCL